MGDPFSVAASILTLLNAGGAIGRFLMKTIALKHAPSIFLALNNDIVDLHNVVHLVDELLQEHSGMTDKASLSRVCGSLEKIKETLSTFEHLISYQLTTIARDCSHLRLDRSQWVRAEPKVQRLREKIRADKGDLCLALTLLTNSYSLQGAVRSRALQVSVNDLQDQVLETSRVIFSQLQGVESSIQAVSKRQRQQGILLRQIDRKSEHNVQHRHTLSSRVQALEKPLRTILDHQNGHARSLQEIEHNVVHYPELGEELSPQSRTIDANLTQVWDHHYLSCEPLPSLQQRQHRSKSRPTSTIPSFSPGKSEGYFQPSCAPDTTKIHTAARSLLDDGELSYTMPFKLTQNRCDSACRCACHQRSQFKSPGSLNTMLGSLFVGYRASPRSARTCSNPDCRQRMKKFTYIYAFPQWFLARILLVDMAYSLSKGPELCLRVMRVRSYDTGVFADLRSRFSGRETALHHLKRMYDEGEISVLDVDTAGTTIVHQAFLSLDFRTAEFLIRCGADVHYQNIWGRSAFLMAWDTFLACPRLVESETFLQEVIWDQSQLDLIDFSELQHAYLGTSSATYHTALSVMSKSAIDQSDSIGGTTHFWASQESDNATIAQLLACGADPHLTESSISSSLRYETLNPSEKSLCLLLASKAELAARNEFGRTPLAHTTYSLEIMKTVLELGADIESQDNKGWRPIHYTTVANDPQYLEQLLNAGADLFARTSFGFTALHVAIVQNRHSILTVLLEAQECTERPKNDVWSDKSFSLALCHADEKTLKILYCAVSEGYHLRVGIETEMDAVAVRLAQWRRDRNQEWSEATLSPRDADPFAWFHSFERLLEATKSSQLQVSKEDCGEKHSKPVHEIGIESPYWDRFDGSEDEERWEDARES